MSSDDEEPEVRRQIASGYARLGSAVGSKDLVAIRLVHAPEYRELRINGDERGLAEAMAEWRRDLDDMIEPRFHVEIESIDLDGNEASVSARSTQMFVSAGLVSLFPSLRFGTRIETTRRDCWMNGGDGWHLLRSEQQLMRSWFNDKLEKERRFEPPLTAQQRASVVRDLAAQAVPFDTVLAGKGFDDLAGLDSLIGDARIVALGEASHGTAEFFQMKHRLLEYLVERKGFTVFAIEANWPEAQVADRFVKTGEGTAADALAAMYFWTWRTEEVRALLDWMRARNTTRGERPVLSFAGFDMQFANVAIKRVTDFLGRMGDADRDAVRQLYDGMDKLDKALKTEIPTAEKTMLRDNAAKALRLIEARHEALVNASSPQDYRDAVQAARIVCQVARMHAGIPWAERDAAMAENVRWLIEEGFPGEKIVLWAHNGHVGTAPVGGGDSLGTHLRGRYGDRMVAIGFTSHHGEVRAKLMADGKFQPGPPAALRLAPVGKTSVEALFHEAGLPRFMLDFRRIPKDSVLGVWLAKPRLHRSVGSGYDPDRDSDSYVDVALPEVYDAVIFISESTPAKSLD